MKRRKDGRLCAKVAIGNGKSKFVYAQTKKEIDRKVTELKIKLGKGLDVQADKDTLLNWINRWLKIKKSEVSLGRYQTYQARIKNLEPLYNTPISQIRTADLQEIALDMFSDGYAAKTIKDYKNAARQIFEMAVDNRVVEYNPAANIKIPAAAPSETKRALTEEEQSWITADSKNRGHTAAMLMLYAGLRRGEMIALTWPDVDFDNKCITVNKTVKFENNHPVLKMGGKTKKATRIVYIPQILIDYLQALPKNKNMLVCPSAKGELMSECAYRKMWSSYQAELNYKFGNFDGQICTDTKTGKIKEFVKPESKYNPKGIPMVIPNITAHMLRHTFITNMYLAGVDALTACEQAGHEDVQTTLNIYTHLDGIYKKKEISKLDDFYAAK